MFRFAHPELLYLLIIIPLLIVFYVVARIRKKKAIAEFGSPELLSTLMPLQSYKRETLKFILVLVALFFVILGVAGPQFGSKLQQVKKRGRGVDYCVGCVKFHDGAGYKAQPVGCGETGHFPNGGKIK